MNRESGFSLVELIIVIGIIGIMSAIGVYSWQRYVANANLRTAARELVADFNFMKANASAKPDLTWSISFNRDVNPSTYTLGAQDANGNNASGFPQTKTPAAAGAAVDLTSLPGGGATYTLTFLARGTLSPTVGTITMQNNRGSTASITYNITGKTYVTFNMQ
ncbi:MAG: prepilin-type N-terminal cleavage/methylation domain-containing protein [Pseudomonadota bacterium]|nr:prepilin-type N-terminal cleavage/methylation domain-containing protein [Pseudomonadota bacterium]